MAVGGGNCFRYLVFITWLIMLIVGVIGGRVTVFVSKEERDKGFLLFCVCIDNKYVCLSYQMKVLFDKKKNVVSFMLCGWFGIDCER